MDFAVVLSILALFFCLASSVNADVDDQDSQRLEDLLRSSDENSDPSAQLAINYDTVQLYKKYRGVGDSDAAIETELDTKVNEFESKVELVEGVPKQGGGFGKFFQSFFTKRDEDERSDAQDAVEDLVDYLLRKKCKILRRGRNKRGWKRKYC